MKSVSDAVRVKVSRRRRRGRWKSIGRGESGDVKERLYDNPLVVIAISTFVLFGADERIKRMETVEKRGSKVATEICSKAHFKINEQ